MGLGDEIMALGRAEKVFEETGSPVSIVSGIGMPREHDAWVGNPAWDPKAKKQIIDGGGSRPYIKYWKQNNSVKQIIFDMDYRPRAGKICLTEEEKLFGPPDAVFALVAPNLKKEASPNKDWGFDKWQEVVRDFPIPVWQMVQSTDERKLEDVDILHTPTFRHAAAAISKAALVMCNEGGTHHMAASMGRHAVVVFGAFTPPPVTGYAFHTNIAVKTPEGFCGNWFKCEHCRAAMEKITPEFVRAKAIEALKGAAPCQVYL